MRHSLPTAIVGRAHVPPSASSSAVLCSRPRSGHGGRGGEARHPTPNRGEMRTPPAWYAAGQSAAPANSTPPQSQYALQQHFHHRNRSRSSSAFTTWHASACTGGFAERAWLCNHALHSGGVSPAAQASRLREARRRPAPTRDMCYQVAVAGPDEGATWNTLVAETLHVPEV